MDRSKLRFTTLPGTPRRVRVRDARGANDKVDFDASALAEVVPISVRIEVGGGRSSTASAMRAAQVQQKLEEVGARALTVEMGGEWAELEAEADRRQMEYVARLPFVRRIRLG